MEDDVIRIDIEKMMFTANGKMNLKVCTDIKKGELLALFGASGAGKTTLLRILAGLVKPDKGTVKFGQTLWFDAENKIDVPPQERNISFMFQDYALFPNMSVAENIAFAQSHANKEEVDQLLETFGLTEFHKRKPSGLSGGQKQRVALARAMARKPQLLLLDEPLSALDSGIRTVLQDEILRAHELLGATTIMVSHDLNEVFRMASQVIQIVNGEIKQSGTPDEVFSDRSISGKVQITGQVARIEKQFPANIVTVISGGNQIIKVIAFDDDIADLQLGDPVVVFSKAFNPIIGKLGK